MSREAPDGAPAARPGVLAPAVAGLPGRGPLLPHDHQVQFYDDERLLAEVVSKFVADGLAARDVVVVIATAEHHQALRERLASDGVDAGQACGAGRLALLDAREILARFMRDGQPDPALFHAEVGSILGQWAPTSGGSTVRAYGEMVDVLWQEGNHGGALRLEELWNELHGSLSFTLLCAYAMAGFYKEPIELGRVCEAHAIVMGPTGAAEAPAATGVSLLQPGYARTLAGEIAHRKEVERALRRSLLAVQAKERELRRSEEQLRDFVENAPVGICRVAADGTILWANRAELELLGYQAPEYLGHSLIEFAADEVGIRNILARLQGEESLLNCEARLRAKDGSIKHLLICSNVYVREGRFVHARWFTRDVTELRRAEDFRAGEAARTERLLKVTAAIADAVSSSEVFLALVDNVAAALGASSAALWLVDEGGETARMVRSVGYSEAGRRQFEVATALDAARPIPALDAIRSGQPIWIATAAELIARYPHLAGRAQHRSYRISCLPLLVEGRALGSLCLTVDEPREITESERDFLMLVARYASQAIERVRLLQAERRLNQETLDARARAEQLYRFAHAVMEADRIEQVFEAALGAIEAALAAVKVAILTLDEGGVMRLRAWRNLSDADRAAAEARFSLPASTVSPEPVLVPDATALKEFAAALRDEGIGALAFIPLTAGGRLVGKFMVYYDRPHRFLSTELETARAIANHLASVITRFAAVARLRETLRFNELFAGVLAHDLRNPLSAIVTNTETLLIHAGRGKLDPQKDAVSLERIRLSADRMDRMIEQLLDLTRARSGGGIALTSRSANLEELCRQAVSELQVANPGWTIKRRVVGDLGGHWDPDRLLQVISNLVANAGQHGAPGEAIQLELDGSNAAQVTLEVRNQGVIPADLVPTIFDPFARGGHRQTSSRGLGLGLFIVQELVRAHGGKVHLESSEAAGTRFTVELPRAAA